MNRVKKAIAAGIGAVGTGMLSVAATLSTTDSDLDTKTTIVAVLIILGGGLATGGATYGVTNDTSE